MKCSVDGCEKGAAPREGGKCYAHAKRRTRKKSLCGPPREYGLTPTQRLAKAARDYADAPDDDRRFEVLWKLLRIAALRAARKNVRRQEKNSCVPKEPRP